MYGGGLDTEYGLVAGAIGATLLVKAYDWWTSRRTEKTAEDAGITLVSGLTERIQKLEERLLSIEGDNSRLRALLYDEQARSARLGLRVISLENEIVKLGGAVPPHLGASE